MKKIKKLKKSQLIEDVFSPNISTYDTDKIGDKINEIIDFLNKHEKEK